MYRIGKSKEVVRIISMLCVLLFSTFFFSASCIAAENSTKVVKVVIPKTQGEGIRDENGHLSGYTYEYLEKIGQFMGWSYEYITFEDLTENESIIKAMEMVKSGEADLMGMVLSDSELQKSYEFTKRNYGVVNTILSVLEGNTSITDVNFMSYSPLRIAILQTANTRNKELENYLNTLNIDYEFILCENTNDQYNSLLNGNADAMLDVSLRNRFGTKKIVEFAPRPYYFVTTKGNTELVQNIDQAIESINYAFPYFEKQLFEKYFGDSIGEFVMTEEEKAYIEKKKELKVLCIDDLAPFVFVNSKEELGGIAVSIMDAFGEATGLKITYQIYNPDLKINSVLDVQEYDCILGAPVNASYKSKYGLISTNSYMQVPMVTFTNKNSLKKEKEECSMAVIRGSETGSAIVGKEILYYENLKECIDAVVKGDADYGYGNSRLVDYYMAESYADLFVLPIVGKEQNMEFIIPNNSEKYLLSLLNGYVQNIDENDLYTYATEVNPYLQKNELESFIRTNPLKAAIFLSIFLFSVFAAIVLFFVVQSTKSKNQQLKIANAAKTDFFSRMSHDMRTPMNAVVGFSEMALIEQQDKNTLIDYMQKINVSGKYLLRLIDDILDMAQIENKKMVLHLEPTDMKELVESVVSIIKPQMDAKNIDFIVEMIGVEKEERSMVDKVHLQQILINLLNNAAKFTKENGTIKWMIENRKETDGNSFYKITIEDNGSGMDIDLLDKLFLPFEQGRDSYIQKGIGLGLAIVKSLVDLMNGKISVKSEVGVGTTFVVELSADMAKWEENDTEYPMKEDVLKGKRVLLCEDQSINTQLATKLLEKRKMKVYTAENGRKAVEMFVNSEINYYDVILMDIRMPVLDGMEATHQIRDLERSDAKKIPIIATTANTFEEDIKMYKGAGMNEHLAKPIDANRMFEILQKLLS